jgi:hypothetical protein
VCRNAGVVLIAYPSHLEGAHLGNFLGNMLRISLTIGSAGCVRDVVDDTGSFA